MMESSDSESKIMRCNTRLADSGSNSLPFTNSHAHEIVNTMEVGNILGFDMIGQEPQIQSFLDGLRWK